MRNITQDKIRDILIQELVRMIKKIAWNMFKQTGNIDTYLELKQIKKWEENNMGENNEKVEDKRDYPSRE